MTTSTAKPQHPAGAGAGALLLGGRAVKVDGLEIVNMYDDKRAQLAAGDFTQRTSAVSQILIHTTKGIYPQNVIPGAGQPGKHLAVADFWRGDPEHSAAHLVVGRAGETACLCDLSTVAAYHATVSNQRSVGIEMYQESDGGIYEATLAATVKLVLALCLELGIQLQVPGRSYRNAPMERMKDGGRNVVGVLGHRDNTHRRGRGDPGDEIFRRLIDAGAEPIITDNGMDLHHWAQRQRALGVAADGIPGARTTAALHAKGFPGGIWALGTEEMRGAVLAGAAARR